MTEMCFQESPASRNKRDIVTKERNAGGKISFLTGRDTVLVCFGVLSLYFPVINMQMCCVNSSFTSCCSPVRRKIDVWC